MINFFFSYEYIYRKDENNMKKKKKNEIRTKGTGIPLRSVEIIVEPKKKKKKLYGFDKD